MKKRRQNAHKINAAAYFCDIKYHHYESKKTKESAPFFANSFIYLRIVCDGVMAIEFRQFVQVVHIINQIVHIGIWKIEPKGFANSENQRNLYRIKMMDIF